MVRAQLQSSLEAAWIKTIRGHTNWTSTRVVADDQRECETAITKTLGDAGIVTANTPLVQAIFDADRRGNATDRPAAESLFVGALKDLRASFAAIVLPTADMVKLAAKYPPGSQDT